MSLMARVVHNFFEDQPVKNASVFLLRLILHDWSDKYAEIILKKLREAATPMTKLLIVDAIVDHACASADAYADIPGAASPPAPSPLLPNFGFASIPIYFQDMQVRQLRDPPQCLNISITPDPVR